MWRVVWSLGWICKVSAEGYENQEVLFEVAGDEATEVNVTLRPPAVSTPTTTSIGTTLPPIPPSSPSSGDGLRSTSFFQTNPAETTIPPTTTTDAVDDIRVLQVSRNSGRALISPMPLLFLWLISFRLLWPLYCKYSSWWRHLSLTLV